MKILIVLVLLVLLVMVLVPIYWACVMAFDESALIEMPNPPRMWPEKFSLFNFKYAFSVMPFLRYFGNTLFVTVVNTVISVFTALMCGYAFSKGKFKFKRFWFIFMLAVMMIPFEARMIPLFLQFQRAHMLNTYWPLILGGFDYSYGMFLSKQNIDKIPDSLRESAFMDGASEWTVFLRIIIPLSKPVIATMCILQSIVNWNNFLWPMIVISKKNMQLISVGIAVNSASETAQYYGPTMAVAILSAIPIILVFLFLQKNIVENMAFSGIKE